MLITYEEYTAMMGNAEADREKTEAALDAAGEMIQKWLHRKILQGEYTEERYFDRPRDRMHLRGYPVAEVSLLTGARQKHLDKENGILRFEAPVCGAVSCTYTGGLEAIPTPIRQACALIAQALMQAADNGGKSMMSERLGDYQVMFYQAKEGRESELDGLSPAAAALLAPYRGINT